MEAARQVGRRGADRAQLVPSARGGGGCAAASALRRRGDLRRPRGRGVLELWPTPQRVRAGVEQEQKPIRAGHVISRPASSGIAHTLRAGAAGITYLSYGTRNPNDVCYYPRSNKIYFRGLGLIARVEDLDYDDGEPQ